MTARDVLTVVPLPSNAPARFEPWDETIRTRARELWSSVAFRNGSRTVRLLRQELGDEIDLPTPSTVNRWAVDDAWAAQADADLERSHGRTLYELQEGWLAALRMAQQTLLDAMAGVFDDLPFGGAARIKAAEATLRTIERSGLLAVVPKPPQGEDDVDYASLSTEEKAARAREILHARKASESNR